jgi:hypothetical protein
MTLTQLHTVQSEAGRLVRLHLILVVVSGLRELWVL